jgi:hypothetical protein
MAQIEPNESWDQRIKVMERGILNNDKLFLSDDKEQVNDDVKFAILQSEDKYNFIHELRGMGYCIKEDGDQLYIMLPERDKYISVSDDPFRVGIYDLDMLERIFISNCSKESYYKNIRETFDHMGLSDQYHNAFKNAGIIKSNDNERHSQAYRQIRCQQNLMKYENNLMEKYGIKTHKELIILRYTLEKAFREAEDDEKRMRIREAIEATCEIELRGMKEKKEREREAEEWECEKARLEKRAKIKKIKLVVAAALTIIIIGAALILGTQPTQAERDAKNASSSEDAKVGQE